MYNVGGGNEVRNVDLTHACCRLLDKPTSLIRPVQDRQGHDRRYALDTGKLRGDGLGADDGFRRPGCATPSQWYRENEWWWRPIKEADPTFKAYYEAQYGKRS